MATERGDGQRGAPLQGAEGAGRGGPGQVRGVVANQGRDLPLSAPSESDAPSRAREKEGRRR
eukprot:12193475-Alexandrium_andersonii.AAC.1